jgi:hypothetical protein
MLGRRCHRDEAAVNHFLEYATRMKLMPANDAGATWQRINDDQHQYGYISRVTGDPRIFGRVYFATGGCGVIYGEPR